MSHWPPSQVGSCKQNNRWARERNRKNAVENTYVEQKWHYTASDFFTFGRCFDDIVQKVMASFNFIPVEEVGLGKLEFIQVILNEEKVSSVSFKCFWFGASNLRFSWMKLECYSMQQTANNVPNSFDWSMACLRYQSYRCTRVECFPAPFVIGPLRRDRCESTHFGPTHSSHTCRNLYATSWKHRRLTEL